MMDVRKLKKNCVIVFLCYCVIAALFYLIAHEQLSFAYHAEPTVLGDLLTGELTAGTVVRQPYTTRDDLITGIGVWFYPFGRTNAGTLNVSVQNENGEELAKALVDAAAIPPEPSGVRMEVMFEPPAANVSGQALTLQIEALAGEPGASPALCYGNQMDAGRGAVTLELSEKERMSVDGALTEGKLCAVFFTTDLLPFGRHYAAFALGAGVLLALYLCSLVTRYRREKQHLDLRLLHAAERYRFLLNQLVARDFKTKYKRSVLGVLWSFLNPLATMAVQYVVFSTIFKADVENYPVYLLAGIVCFSFFTDATTLALSSITGNVSLITKVYVPKYIYPLARTLSSSINLLFSMGLLLTAVVITGTPLTSSVLLLPFGIVCLFLCSLGVGLILAALMVFFRDTQFLWGVMNMIWLYATPIFYPESIIPAQWRLILRVNPVYHIIRFFRTILISGVSPEPSAYLYCLIAAVIPLAAGLWAFKKTQDKFVLYL